MLSVLLLTLAASNVDADRVEPDIVEPDLTALLPAVGSAGGPSRELSEEEARSWLAGRELFERDWTDDQGLGRPGFNARSCAACHQDPATGGSGDNDCNVISTGRGHYYLSNALVRPTAATVNENVQALARKQRDEALAAGRPARVREMQTPSILGLGLIEAIPDREILRREDPDDRDGDGIRGIARRSRVGRKEEVGRFGWTGQAPRLDDFVCMALGGELGLTAPDQGRGFALDEDEDKAQDPELPQEELDDLSFFVAHLAPPRRAGQAHDYRVQIGEKLFEQIGCAACHVPSLAGPDGPLNLYSDLLLHGVVSPTSGSGQGLLTVRTPPLWGLRDTGPYLHDGRAASIREAVEAHRGEAVRVMEQFDSLIEMDKEALVRFLEDL